MLSSSSSSTSSRTSLVTWVRRRLYLPLLASLILCAANTAFGGHIVKNLPGFDGDLPFKLETGYVSVGESELFYYFVESEGNPREDPLFLWLTGGPGCTAFSGLIYEVGPLEYDVENYSEGFPKLKYYPYARTKSASMIFLDAPVGTGFSYARTHGGWHSSDTKSVEQSYQFLRKWLQEHPQYASIPLFIGGDSYAGLAIPMIVKTILNGNQEKAAPFMNIKGYLVGCPLTDFVADMNSRVDFAHRIALISDEIYENAKRSCNENYLNVDPDNTACLTALRAVERCVEHVSDRDVLQPKCDVSANDNHLNMDRRYLEGISGFLLSPSIRTIPYCTIFRRTHNNIWANDERVQEAIHVRKGTISHWQRCNDSLAYIKDVLSVVHVHKELSKFPLQVLVESGDHDMSLPYLGTLKWIKTLNLTLNDDWRPWFVDDQVAGYTMKYSSSEEDGYHLTFASLKGAGHPAPEYKRRECFYLFDRWIRYNSV